MASIRARTRSLAGVALVFSLVTAPAIARGEGCVVSPDGLVLHRPAGKPCDEAEREARIQAERRRRGELNDFDLSAEIPPANPFVASDVRVRLGRGPWLPAEPGTRLLYRHTLERKLYAGPHLARRIHYQGDRSDEVLAAERGIGDATVEIRIRERLVAGAGDVRETQRHYVVPGAAEYRPVASEVAVWGNRVVVRQPEDSELLAKGARPGKRWAAGIEVVDGLAFRREGEVMGVQDVETPLGHFEKCLVVRYTGTLTRPGLSPLRDGTRVESGKLVTTDWIARGIGRVQSRQVGDLGLGAVDNLPGRLTFEARSQLYQVQRRAALRDPSPAAAPSPNRAGSARDASWVVGAWRLALVPGLPLGSELPAEEIRFRSDGMVDLAKETRVYASCPYALEGDMLAVRCRDSETLEKRILDLVPSPERRVLTTALGSQYRRAQ